MYRSKLQTLCERKSWGSPEFSTTKCGFDHNPSFSATVTVNGIPFTTTDQSRTSGEAQSKAAKIAFDHFSANSYPDPFLDFPQPSLVAANASFPTSLGTETSIQKLDVGLSARGISQPTMTETMQSALMFETLFGVKDDMRHLYKNRLQSYAQKRHLPLPVYSSEREGPPHASLFKSKVTIEGKTYGSGSLEFFPTQKEAEHAAAKVALESLSVNEVQKDGSGLYKNLLQELTQKEGLEIPKYKTNNIGPPHKPTFVSTVEIGGRSFEGQEAKNKKQAETNAAKVAYTALKEHNEPVASGSVGLIPSVFNSGWQLKKALEASSSILQSVIADDLQQSKINLVNFKEQSKEDMVDDFTDDFQRSAALNANLEVREEQENEYKDEITNHHYPPPSPDTDINSKRQRCCVSVDNINASLLDSFPFTSSSAQNKVFPFSVPSESSISSTLNSHNGTPLGGTNVMNALPREKTYVYPRVPNMILPEGATVLPCSDDKWVAVKMKSS